MEINNLSEIQIKRRKGDEFFCLDKKKLDFDLLEFWQWNSSDLINNATRGKLAEFIVAKALGIESETRREWDTYDLLYGNIKIEVKASAYVQGWEQSRYSNIIFGIQPTRELISETNYYGNEAKRQADVYIFCLLKHKDQDTLEPLDLSQWEFYILSTKVLNDVIPSQKSITLGGLLKLNPFKVRYNDIKKTVNRMFAE